LAAQEINIISLYHSKLALYDWSVKATPNLATNPPSIKIVEGFLNALQLSLGGEADFGDNGNEYVCSFTFADLRSNGYLSLIAGIGITGRGMCRGVYIIDKTASSFETYLSEGDPEAGNDVSDKIKDLHRDGKQEFLLSNQFGEIKDQCRGNWTAIFAWTGGGYTNVSDSFKNFYRQQLDSLNQKISALHPIPLYGGGVSEPRDKECLLAEAAKLQRYLGISPEAGLDQAIQLANSEDPAKRHFAVEILGAIGTPGARNYLEILARDSDSGVRLAAKFYRSVLSKGRVEAAPNTFVHLQGPESLPRY
jgi:hypothetical protein